jgi:hypothetical protein
VFLTASLIISRTCSIASSRAFWAFSSSDWTLVAASSATVMVTRNSTMSEVMRSANEIQNGFSASSRPPRRVGTRMLNIA